MFSILVVEDDAALNRMICAKLKAQDYSVFSAYNGEEALDLLDHQYVDLIISDIMMPVMDGITLIRELREAQYTMPVLIITAKDQMEDMEKGFEAGTDDYMIKPINLKEMVLRVQALLRRSQLANEKKLRIGSSVLDYDTLTVTVGGKEHTLPPKQFYLLYKLLGNPNKIFTRLELLDEIWGMDTESDERNVDAHVKKLRRTFDGNPDFEIVTVRGLGYKGKIK
ncbi:MAG: response regulator transcription factor [Acutalibacteraceae bacterium]